MDKNDNERLFEPEVSTPQHSLGLSGDGQAEQKDETLDKAGHAGNWKVLLVDDEEDIHSVTLMALKGFTYQGKEILFLHAYTGEEAKQILSKEKDIALIFLDVVMETNRAGLDLVKHIRDIMKNHFTQIVLRTGYPGQAPEREVIATYEINDYKTKTELTSFKMFTVTLASLRAFDSIMRLENLRQNLEQIVKKRTAELEKKNIMIMEMDQMKTRFFSNLSHEFRTPLTLIISPVENMLVDKEISSSKKDTLELVHRNALRLLGLVNQLLDLSKIDAGSMKLNLIYYDLHKVLRLIARSFIPMAERKNISYNISIPDETLTCFFDRDKLEKILVNLLSNAFKYTPQKGKIDCSVGCEKVQGTSDTGYLEMTVRDSGPGIPVGELGKIFDRFYQVEDGWKKEGGGTGIGLSLTRELTVLQHGEISVQSELQKGCCFRVRIPVGKDHLKKHEYNLLETDESEGPSINLKCSLSDPFQNEHEVSYEITGSNDLPLLLIVDDNPEIRNHIREFFSSEFIVKESANGNDGLEKTLTLIPDLVITDLKMPQMDGITLCSKLKNDERTCHIPVIMLTGKAEADERVKGLETGADDYITKPFSNKELMARVKNLIAQRRKLFEKFNHQVSLDAANPDFKSADEKFLARARKVIEKNIGDCSFDVNSFYPEMGMSRMQLFRKMKALVNQTPSELIRNLRLQRAAQLIKQKYGNVAEVTYEVGFNNLSYFAKCFKEKYGLLPSEYQKQIVG